MNLLTLRDTHRNEHRNECDLRKINAVILSGITIQKSSKEKQSD